MKSDVFLKCFLIILIINALLVLSLLGYLTFKPNNYRVYDYNLMWKECGIQFSQPLLSGETYCKIKGVPIRELIACRSYQGWLGAGHDHFVMVKKGFEPTITLDVTSARIFLGINSEYVSKEEWHSLASAVNKFEIAAIAEDIARELADLIISEDGIPNERSGPTELIWNADHYMLMLQFELEEYENIVWIAKIVHSGGSYFIRINNGKYKYDYYLPCPEEFAALIDKAIAEYGLTFYEGD